MSQLLPGRTCLAGKVGPSLCVMYSCSSPDPPFATGQAALVVGRAEHLTRTCGGYNIYKG